MALEVKNNMGVLSISGELNAQNTNYLKQHYETFLKQLDDLVLSLEGVTSLDAGSAIALEQMYLSAIRDNKVLHIIGRQNENITSVLAETKTYYILSSDRI